MNNQKAASAVKLAPDQLNDLIIDSITDIKGQKIIKINLTEIDDAPTDYFIICEGTSNTQVGAIADNIRKRTKEEAAIGPNHIEGNRAQTWILLDYFDTVVHVFYSQTREFYDLEDLWSDGAFTEYDSL